MEIVGTRLGEARPVLPEVVVAHSIAAEPASEFQADALGTGGQTFPFDGLEGWGGRQEAARACLEQGDVETGCIRVVFSPGIAPAPPRVAEFAGQVHRTDGVEVEQADHLVPFGMEAKIRDLEVPVTGPLGEVESPVPGRPRIKDLTAECARRHLERMTIGCVEGGLEFGHSQCGVVDVAAGRDPYTLPAIEGCVKGTDAAGLSAS